MKKIILLLFLVLALNTYSQHLPKNYSLGNETEALNKINDVTPAGNSITDIVVDPNGTIWLGTSRGLSKSTDNGLSWTNYLGHPDFGSNGIIALGYNNGAIWVTTGRSTDVAGGSSLPEGTGIKFSTNDGESWTSFNQPVDDPGDSSITYGINTLRALPVTTTVQNISYDIAFTEGTVWVASFAGGLRKSLNNGESWERVLLPPDDLDSISPSDTLDFTLQPVAGRFGNDNNLNHRLFSVIGVDDTTLYVGTAGGINKSVDNGISWTKFSHQNQIEPISGNFVVALGYNTRSNSVWAATWKAEDQDEYWAVSSSFDEGDTWQVVLPEERAHNFGFKYYSNPSFPTRNDVFIPTDNGIYRSADNGTSWTSPAQLVDDLDGETIKTKVFYSAASKIIDSDSNDVWIGSAQGLARIREGGSTWGGQWKVLKAKLGEKDTYAFPNPFSPNIDNGIVTIVYPVGSSVAGVSVRVFDFGMNLVKVIAQNKSVNKNDKAEEYWNGTDEFGRTVANGVYFYRVDVNDEEPIFGKIMVIK